MPTLLHIDASCSPQETSLSRQLTADFVAEWKATHAESKYLYRDVAADPIAFVGAAYASMGQRLEHDGPIDHHDVPSRLSTNAERTEWELTSPLIDEVLSADTILLGVPMYNFSVPASLKAWIDRITFPGVYIEPETQAQRLASTEVVVVCARGGAYGPETPRHDCDFQEPYLRAWFTSHLGVPERSIHFVHAEMTRADDIPYLHEFREFGQQSLAAARARVKVLAGGSVPSDALTSAES